MKSAEESLGISSEEYNKIVDDCIYGKHTDKIEPKFKIGDFIVNDYCMGRIVEITNDAYLLDTEQGIPLSCEHNAHLWTIQDAKPGDVIYLPNGNNEYYLFLFKGIENAAVMSFAHFYQYNDGTSKVEGTTDNLCSVNDVFQPATKEQRDLLFQKMKEARYEWDAKRKKLKNIDAKENLTLDGDLMEADCMIAEQKPTWSEEDDYNVQCLVAKVVSDIQNGNVGRNQELIDWLKSLKQMIGG
jgi:hypothetical protein